MDAFTWTTKATALREAGGGAFTLDIVMHHERSELDRRAVAGDPRSRHLLRTMLEMNEAVAARGRGTPAVDHTAAFITSEAVSTTSHSPPMATP